MHRIRCPQKQLNSGFFQHQNALHFFAHFLHIGELENRCTQVQTVQRIQRKRNTKITANRVKLRILVKFGMDKNCFQVPTNQ